MKAFSNYISEGVFAREQKASIAASFAMKQNTFVRLCFACVQNALNAFSHCGKYNDLITRFVMMYFENTQNAFNFARKMHSIMVTQVCVCVCVRGWGAASFKNAFTPFGVPQFLKNC